jgi:hypothetical protein
LSGDETKFFITQIPYRFDLNPDDLPALEHGSEIFEDRYRGERRSVQMWLQTQGFKREERLTTTFSTAAATPFLHACPGEA